MLPTGAHGSDTRNGNTVDILLCQLFVTHSRVKAVYYDHAGTVLRSHAKVRLHLPPLGESVRDGARNAVRKRTLRVALTLRVSSGQLATVETVDTIGSDEVIVSGKNLRVERERCC
jgi:hypothetical protein